MISLLVFDVGIFLLVDAAGAVEKQAVGHLHDVGLVEHRDLSALPAGGVAKGKPGDARAGDFASPLSDS